MIARFAARAYEPVFGRLLAGMRRAVLSLAPPVPGALVVDVGCGTGALLAVYAAAGCRVAGIDSSPYMVGEARRRLGPEAGLSIGSAGALPLRSGSARLVVATMLFHELDALARRAALEEMRRVLAPVGRLVVADHAVGPGTGLGRRSARLLARVVEGAAGHRAGVRALIAEGGIAGVTAACGWQVEQEAAAAGGVIAVMRLRPVAVGGE